MTEFHNQSPKRWRSGSCHLADLEKEQRSAKDSDLKAFVTKTLPTLKAPFEAYQRRGEEVTELRFQFLARVCIHDGELLMVERGIGAESEAAGVLALDFDE